MPQFYRMLKHEGHILILYMAWLLLEDKIARSIPYNKVIIKCANIFQVISFYLTMVPKEIMDRNITIEGYKGLKCKVEIFEPSNVRKKLPCLIYVHGGAQGIDSDKIGVAGDSAGASIAALVCNNYEHENLKQPCIQMFVYPLTDVTMQTDSMKQFSDTPLWNAKNNNRMWTYYCRNLKNKDIYAASPIHKIAVRNIKIPYTILNLIRDSNVI